jgi:hypothetical protein
MIVAAARVDARAGAGLQRARATRRRRAGAAQADFVGLTGLPATAAVFRIRIDWYARSSAGHESRFAEILGIAIHGSTIRGPG